MRRDCFYFCPPFRVRYGEVDQQGIVYNGNYVAYTDLAFEEFLRSKGYSYRELAEKHDSEVCHKKSTYEFVSSAYAGDMLEVGISKIKIGKKSFTIQFEIYHQGEDDLILLCESVYVGYDVENRTSRPITDLMRALLSS
ncbi:acyl-CoA thioesterase [Agathobaculum sp. NSJ-28]|uniref:Acyl-CoA thioesterase n=2 Tax=Agathobaculum TaxID=2048137 RepID=A0A923LWN9_9FIRM|nr:MULTISPECIES: thioesterase family protein [Butyricicoccaceae]MBS5623506.1 acyl-CoA thioesterase [Clostridium sp.]MBS6883947.1 acyl-CoA thioesterase [Clostridiaceae bacterium]SCJ22280.1 acyl-CoA thioesterase YbgC [uncultured Butyricicoccus sp.]MBC5726549.1 acyl-CoA thioesterase [Agathobaculum faecis]MCU6789474.1 acyl-CoA thioesterase [Agathobaculum ammoniilyticum]